MTDAERNELVEKLKKFVAPITYRAAILEIESLGYEIAKKPSGGKWRWVTEDELRERMEARQMTPEEREATTEIFWSLFNSPSTPPS